MDNQAKVSRMLQRLRIVYLLAVMGLFFTCVYFVDKPFAVQTIVDDIVKMRLYVGLLLALLAALSLEVIVLKVLRLAQVPIMMIVMRILFFLIIGTAYITVS